jgi:hypothetical protein
MAEQTPQIEALTNKLLGSDEQVAAFKSDPEPHLQEAGVALSPEQLDELKQHLATHDVESIKMKLTNNAMHTMFSQKA